MSTMQLWLKVTLFLFIAKTCSSNVNTPVFCWGKSIKNYRFQEKDNFLDTLTVFVSNGKKVVIFVEKQLNNEDFSRNDGEGNKLFSNLYNYSKTLETIYITSLNNPLSVLNTSVELLNISIANFNPTVASLISKIIVINFEDNEGRSDIFKRHDEKMKQVFDFLQKHLDVVALYTGYSTKNYDSKKSRQLLQTKQTCESIIIIDDPYVLLYFNREILFKEKGKDDKRLTLCWEQGLVVTGNEIQFSLKDQTNDFAFIINYSNVSWKISSVNLNNIKMHFEEIEVPMGFSYHCPKLILKNRHSKIETIFSHFQIEIFRKPNYKHKFSPAFDCINFFDIPILTSLCVSGFLLMLLMIAILFLLDIQTSKYVDDPSKPYITISAEE